MASGEITANSAPIPFPATDPGRYISGRVVVPPTLPSNRQDERDAFLGWLRGEFAAANAIIDCLCAHLRVVGAPGEYDCALACLHQRRYNWALVLHMQHYFSIAEVAAALQQVATWRTHHCHIKPAAFHQPPPMPLVRPNNPRTRRQNSPSSSSSFVAAPPRPTPPPSSNQTAMENSLHTSTKEFDPTNGEPLSRLLPSSSPSVENMDAKLQTLSTDLDLGKGSSQKGSRNIPKKPEEDMDAKLQTLSTDLDSEKGSHNVPTNPEGSFVEGDLNAIFQFSSKEDEESRLAIVKASKNICKNDQGEGILVNHVAGLELFENVFNSLETTEVVRLIDKFEVIGRRGYPCDESLKPMPHYLQAVVDCLVRWKILPASKRPDRCTLHFLDEGSQAVLPLIANCEIEPPSCILSLVSDCTVFLDNAASFNGQGDFKTAHELILPVGSVLVVQGHASKMVACLPASQSRRLLVTFAKVLPKSSSRRRRLGDKEVPSYTTALPNSSTLKQVHAPIPRLLLPNHAPPSSQPLMGAGWPILSRPPPHPPTMGTGVFLPSGGTPNSPCLPLPTPPRPLMNSSSSPSFSSSSPPPSSSSSSSISTLPSSGASLGGIETLDENRENFAPECSGNMDEPRITKPAP